MKTEPSKADLPARRPLVRLSPSFWVAEEFQDALARLGLTSLEAVFAFASGRDLPKASIGPFRRRMQFEVQPAGSEHPVKVFLKRYDRPPASRQLRNWLCHHTRRSFARIEHETAEQLAAAGIRTPRTIAWGEQRGGPFERRSFLMTEEIPDSQSLDRRPPACFTGPPTTANVRARREFLQRLASFIRRFHETGYRHRDLYLSHIFCSDSGEFCLIDMARASRPILQRRFQIKDLAALHYSAPAQYIARTDRLRFYLAYTDRPHVLPSDKVFLRTILRKADRMARHGMKHGIPIPYLGR